VKPQPVKHMPLGEVADVIRGVTFRKSDAADSPASDRTPVLRAGNIGKDLDLDNGLVWVPSDLVLQKQRTLRGDIVMCASSGSSVVVGKSAPLRQQWNGTIGAFCIVIRPKSKACDPGFLGFFLGSPHFRQWASQAPGANIKNIRKSDLQQYLVPLPPLDEQRRIVAILNRAAKIERLKKQAQERLREFIPALFVKMFGDPAGNPMGWPVLSLGELSVIGPQYGANARSKTLLSGEPRYVRITDIQEGGGLSDEAVGVPLPNWEKYRLRDGDLLFARSGATVGKPYIYRPQDGLCVFAGYLIRFRLEATKLHPEVLFGLTQTYAYSAWVKSKRRTVAQPNINGREFATLRIPVPPRRLQNQYVQMVEAARSTAALADSGVAVSSALNMSLMPQLLQNQSPSMQYHPSQMDMSLSLRQSGGPASGEEK